MHPASSIIAFTTLSGLGFGLLFWLGIDGSAPTGWVGFAFFAIGFLLACAGLIASTFHLGRPERALKAFTQWRSSWLSREGWASVAALVVMGLYALPLIFMDRQMVFLGWFGAALCLVTVFTTSMIYSQLKTVPRWNQVSTPVLFLVLAVAGGALLSGRVWVTLILLVLAGGVQLVWWLLGDRQFAESGASMASATGLGDMGQVRAFEPPHTGTNYLMNEMVHVVGRKHAVKLRLISFVLMVVLPVVLLLGVLLVNATHLLAGLAVISHIAGVAASRWLFFAEAEHVVGLYYGKR